MNIEKTFWGGKAVSQIYLIVVATLLTVGILAALNNQANGYEKSIYISTPLIFWISTLLAALTPAIFFINSDRFLGVSSAIGGLGIFSIVSVPVIRGYYFYSEGDAMTHLGFVKSIISTGFSPDLLYPSTHIFTSILSIIAGFTPNIATLLVPIIFILMFMSGVAIISRRIYLRNTTAVGMTITIAMMLLPVGTTGIHFSPNGLTRFFSPLLLYVIVRFLSEPQKRLMSMMAIIFGSLVFMHPQNTLTMIIIVCTLPMIFKAISYYKQESWVQSLQPIIRVAQIGAVTFILLFLWVNTRSLIIYSLRGFILSFADPNVGASSGSLAQSLDQVGGNPSVVAAKLFIPEIILILVTIYLVIIWVVSKRWMVGPEKLVLWLSLANIPIFLLFVVGFLVSKYHMRYFADSMVFVTIVSPFGILLYFEGGRKFRHLFTCLLCIMLVMSVITIYPSPYTYLGNRQVPESQYNGYATTFEYEREGMNYVKVRSSAYRYADSMGVPMDPVPSVPDHFSGHQISEQYSNDAYLIITAADRVRDADVYNGFRFSDSDFRYIYHRSYTNKVVTTGTFDLFII